MTIVVGSLVKPTRESYKYFNRQMFLFQPTDIFIVERVNDDRTYCVRNIRTNDHCNCFYHRVVSYLPEYDPDQEPKDDCL